MPSGNSSYVAVARGWVVIFKEMNKKSISILMFLSVIILSSGCGTIIGKRVDVEEKDVKALKKYKNFIIKRQEDSESIYIERSIESLMRVNGLKKFYHQEDLDQLNEDYLIFKAFISDGFCLPPQIGHCFSIWYFLPTYVNITLLDGRTKKELYTVEYHRALLAFNAGPPECEDMVIGELRKAFIQAGVKQTVNTLSWLSIDIAVEGSDLIFIGSVQKEYSSSPYNYPHHKEEKLESLFSVEKVLYGKYDKKSLKLRFDIDTTVEVAPKVNEKVIVIGKVYPKFTLVTKIVEANKYNYEETMKAIKKKKDNKKDVLNPPSSGK